MNKTKSIIYITAALLAGFILGYLFFAQRSNPGEADRSGTSAEANPAVWTCSMHPQIRQPEPGDCPICGMELIPLDEMARNENPLVLEMTQEAVKLAEVRTLSVGGKPDAQARTLSLNGKIKMDERLSSSQVAHFPGRIEQLFVTFTGEQVKKGQKLATIYSPELVDAQNEFLEALKWKNTQPQLVEAAANKLRNWKLSESFIEELQTSGKVQNSLAFYADQSGVVVQKRVSVGDYVKAGSVLLDLAQLNKLWILFDAYEEDLANIKLGSPVTFTTASLPGKEFQTRISFIDPVVNPKTRIVSLRAEIPNNSGVFKPEMFVKGIIQTPGTVGTGKMTVPKTAVMWTGKRSVVYVKVPDTSIPSFEYREVTLGESQGESYLIESGLQPGEEIVVHGTFMIDAAAQLNNMASMMNRHVRQVGNTEASPDYSQQTDDAFRKSLNQAVQDYLDIKDYLVATDPKKAQSATRQFENSLQTINGDILKGSAQFFWMEKQKEMLNLAQKISQTSEVQMQRELFSSLSDELSQVISTYGNSGDTLYLQFCPMAIHDQGAAWLSAEKNILNPYFGDKMLTCGTVKKTFTGK